MRHVDGKCRLSRASLTDNNGHGDGLLRVLSGPRLRHVSGSLLHERGTAGEIRDCRREQLWHVGWLLTRNRRRARHRRGRGGVVGQWTAVQDRLMDLLKFPARLDAKLVDEGAARTPEGIQCLRLASGP